MPAKESRRRRLLRFCVRSSRSDPACDRARKSCSILVSSTLLSPAQSTAPASRTPR